MLNGILVLDLSRVLAGPYCTMQLADLGATVLKIEHPNSGDDTRAWGPPFAFDRTAAYFCAVNRGKQSVAVDLNAAEGQSIVRRLAAAADVIVENFKPDSLAKRRLDYESVRRENPSVIYCSVTGYGQTGEWKNRGGYDFIIQGECGLMAASGEADGSPMKAGVAVCDILAGLNATLGILAALFRREKTNGGAYLDIALLDCAASAMANVAQAALMEKKPPRRFGNHHPHIVPYGVFSASDGEFNLAVGNDSQFASLCKIIGEEKLAKDSRFAKNPSRVKYRDELIPLLNSAFAFRPADDWLDQFNRAGIPSGKVMNVWEMLSNAHAKSRELIADAGGIPTVASPLRFNNSEKASLSPPPILGEHTESALRRHLNFDKDAIADLHRKNIIHCANPKVKKR